MSTSSFCGYWVKSSALCLGEGVRALEGNQAWWFPVWDDYSLAFPCSGLVRVRGTHLGPKRGGKCLEPVGPVRHPKPRVHGRDGQGLGTPCDAVHNVLGDEQGGAWRDGDGALAVPPLPRFRGVVAALEPGSLCARAHSPPHVSCTQRHLKRGSTSLCNLVNPRPI